MIARTSAKERASSVVSRSPRRNISIGMSDPIPKRDPLPVRSVQNRTDAKTASKDI
jgi:hypothetical protein